jgi:hypothetical protein
MTTLHELVDELERELKLTPEQKFRVTAKIKRLIHYEKASSYHRYFLYSQGAPIFEGEGDNRKLVGREPAADEWLSGILSDAYENHQHWANKSDEEIVTWDVGSHKFKQ